MDGNTLITGSMRLLGVYAPGETPTAADMQDGLSALNTMLDGWNAERLAIFTITRSEFSLTVNQQVYTVGAGGDFNIARPARIERISIISLNNPVQPLELPMEMLTFYGWQNIPVKDISSTLPLQVYDDGAFPLRNLSYWPIPSTAVDTALYYWTALGAFADLTTDYTFPPGYQEALQYNLAVRLAPIFGRSTPPEVVVIAESSKAKIKSMNIIPLNMRCDDALVPGQGGYYDYRSDSVAGGRNS